MKLKISLVLLLLAIAPPVLTSAQAQSAVTKDTSVQAVKPAPQLPAADLILYINPRILINDALPRYAPPAFVTELRENSAQLQELVGTDISKADFAAVAIRLHKAEPRRPVPLPEFVFVARGELNGAALVGVASMLGGPVREEKYGARTVNILTLTPIAKASETNELLAFYTELAIANIDNSMIVVGTPDYVRSTLVALDHPAETAAANSTTRAPDTVIGVDGSLLAALARGLALIGTDSTKRSEECLDNLGRMHFTTRLNPSGVSLLASVNAGNPETALILKNMMLFFGAQAMGSSVDASTLLTLANMISIDGNDLVVKGDVSDEVVKAFLKGFVNGLFKSASSPVFEDPVFPPQAKPAVVKHRTKTTRRKSSGKPN